MSAVELLERADPQHLVSLPGRPEGHFRGPQAREIERMRAAPRRFRPRAVEVDVQQGDDAGIVQTAFHDVHGEKLIRPFRSARRSPYSLAAQTSSVPRLFPAMPEPPQVAAPAPDRDIAA